MFKRRVPRPLFRKVCELIWPRSGWRRSSLYVWHRLHRLPGSTYSIAAGFAFGAAVSFTPLPGAHFVLAALCAWIARANVLASAIGTAVGNPWTFPPMWLSTYYVGQWMTGGTGAGAEGLDFRAVFHALWYGIRHMDAGHLVQHVWPVWWPMIVGSIPLAILSWFVFYMLLKRGIASYHRLHGTRRLERLAARARDRGKGEGRTT